MPNLSWLRIPQELRERKQWLVCTLTPIPGANGKVDKQPRNPVTRLAADVTDPATWGTFEEAMNSGLDGIGYVLSESDPYAVIDLDDKDINNSEQRARHAKIYGAFASYAELSQSGRGCHIIVRGKIGGGLHRDGVEVYDQERFIICTGKALRDSPILDFNEMLNLMVREMGGINIVQDLSDLPNEPEKDDDETILKRAENARNGDRFKDLFYRKTLDGEDWSQRDAALAQIICFYTRNQDQALRLFRRSALYRPDSKGKNAQHYEEYYLLRKTFGRAWRAEDLKNSPADLELGRTLAENLLAKTTADPPPVTPLDFPQGLIGEVASYIYGAATRPVKEIALAGAIAFMAGIAGRQYNVSNTGLNLYVVLLAETGRGKEAAPSGIEGLVHAMRASVPSIELFLGPSRFASGPALIRSLDKSNCCVSLLGEFGHTLRQLTDRKANAADVALRQALLSLFSKSGKGQVLRASVYSDSEKNTNNVMAPAFSFLGDTTPEAYYSCFTSGMIAEGLIPRFLTISYHGKRPPMNETPNQHPSQGLMDRLGSLVSSVVSMMQNNTFLDIGMDPEANNASRAFNQFCDDKINDPAASAFAELWNRAHLKMLRLAALIAVGRNHLQPLITAYDVEWARKLVVADVDSISSRIEGGDVGNGENRRMPQLVAAITAYLRMSPKQRANYRVPDVLQDKPIIPYVYFRRRLRNAPGFEDNGMLALKEALKDAVDMDYLQVVSRDQKLQLGRLRADTECYILGPAFKEE